MRHYDILTRENDYAALYYIAANTVYFIPMRLGAVLLDVARLVVMRLGTTSPQSLLATATALFPWEFIKNKRNSPSCCIAVKGTKACVANVSVVDISKFANKNSALPKSLAPTNNVA